MNPTDQNNPPAPKALRKWRITAYGDHYEIDNIEIAAERAAEMVRDGAERVSVERVSVDAPAQPTAPVTASSDEEVLARITRGLDNMEPYDSFFTLSPDDLRRLVAIVREQDAKLQRETSAVRVLGKQRNEAMSKLTAYEARAKRAAR